MTQGQTIRQRLARLLADEPNLSRDALAARLGAPQERVSQLLGTRAGGKVKPRPITLDDRTLLVVVIKASGLSVRRFAREQLARDERSVRRWLTGELPIPAVVRARLEAWHRTPPPSWRDNLDGRTP